jgi:hypothetical protein
VQGRDCLVGDCSLSTTTATTVISVAFLLGRVHMRIVVHADSACGLAAENLHVGSELAKRLRARPEEASKCRWARFRDPSVLMCLVPHSTSTRYSLQPHTHAYDVDVLCSFGWNYIVGWWSI